jgi:hypothetical protein
MWSFNRDGEADEALKADFQAGLGIAEADRRAKRRGLVEHAHPQEGVDALAGAFEGTAPLEGVVEKGGRGPVRPG